jgi:hypothetical protein
MAIDGAAVATARAGGHKDGARPFSAARVPLNLGRRRALTSLTRWLDRPRSLPWCAVGWLAATGIFIVLTQVLGGLGQHDTFLSVNATWAIAHGRLSCAYPAGIPMIAPLYPMVSGGIVALVHVGHGVPFPSSAAMGPHCSRAVAALSTWSAHAGALGPTVEVGYLGWLALLGGVVAFLRSVGRGRCGWEPLTLIVLAVTPPVLMCVQTDFHPQDLLAMGLALAGVACARSGRWALTGVLLGLAVASQQFALLVLAPMLVVVPTGRRVRLCGAAVAGAGLAVAPLLLANPGRARRAGQLGSGNSASRGYTVLGQLQLHGALLIVMSRILPILLTMMLARWACRRLGPRILDPVPLVSLISTAFALRLVFEENLFGYYLMALVVSLVLLDVVRRRIGVHLVAWLALALLVFDPLPWGRLPLAQVPLPLWFWQVVLLSTGTVMAAGPLLTYVKQSASAHVRLSGTQSGASKGSDDDDTTRIHHEGGPHPSGHDPSGCRGHRTTGCGAPLTGQSITTP